MTSWFALLLLVLGSVIMWMGNQAMQEPMARFVVSFTGGLLFGIGLASVISLMARREI